MADITRFLVSPDMSIREVMTGIGNADGLALVVDAERLLLGTVSDGDIRRAILAGEDMDQPCSILLERYKPRERATPMTAPVGMSDADLISMMLQHGIRHVPLLDEAGRVQEVAILSELVRDYELPLTAVVMAGGAGSRLRPLTERVPKPMLPLGDRPLLEHIVGQLRSAGIRKVNITTHYKAEVIEQHFGDGSRFGVDISYVDEEQPLGTAGALSRIEAAGDCILVINGDIVTDVDFRAMLDFHQEHHADMTVALREHEVQMPYGVLEMEGVEIRRASEKPIMRYMINAGIYLVSQEVCRMVPNGRRYDMTDLISELIATGHRVIGFPVQEYWMDIGQLKDYEKAQAEARNRLSVR